MKTVHSSVSCPPPVKEKMHDYEFENFGSQQASRWWSLGVQASHNGFASIWCEIFWLNIRLSVEVRSLTVNFCFGTHLESGLLIFKVFHL